MNQKHFITGTLLIVLLAVTGYVFPQCAGYAQKWCPKQLADGAYQPSPQLLTAAMGQGESTKINMNFFKGHDYRLVFCAEEHLGNLGVKVMSSKGEVLFNNADHDNAIFWDFSMKSSQRLVIEVTAPGASEQEVMEGCVAIAVGLKPSIKKGFN